MPERTILLIDEAGTSIELPAPVGPYSPDDSPNQSFTLSGGKVMRVASFGGNEYIYPMRLRDLTQEKYDELEVFITVNLRLTSNPCQIVDFREQRFDYQRPKDNMYYIRGLETTSINNDRYSLTLQFQRGIANPIQIGTSVGDFDLSLGRVRTADD